MQEILEHLNAEIKKAKERTFHTNFSESRALLQGLEGAKGILLNNLNIRQEIIVTYATSLRGSATTISIPPYNSTDYNISLLEHLQYHCSMHYNSKCSFVRDHITDYSKIIILYSYL